MNHPDVANDPRDAAAHPLRGTDAPGRPDPGAETARTDGVRDTIESIVVAFILAFVFRAFVVEAFVIPTGSMAPGLYGKHAEHRCALCNYPFTYGLREDMVQAGGAVSKGTLASEFSVRCPNCGWDEAGNRGLNTRERAVAANSGDRILVLKWPYDIGGALLGPRRWDVVVFKDPQDGETNYIKRLLGLPGEVIEIINGDLYTAPESAVPRDILDALGRAPPTGRPGSRRLTDEQHARLARVLKIRRKTRIAQESLWMIHYDHDYRPNPAKLSDAQRLRLQPPAWEETGAGAPAWDASKPLVRFNPRDAEEHCLRLTGRPIQDSYGYNDVFIPYQQVRSTSHNVGDVRLRFVLFPLARAADKAPVDPAGYLELRLRRHRDDFRARISPSGEVKLSRFEERTISYEVRTGRIPPLRPDQPRVIEYENVDFRVCLRIDGEEVVWTDDSQYAPRIEQMLAPPYEDGRFNETAVALCGRALPLEIRHLVVERDVFYTSDMRFEPHSMIHRNTKNPYADYPGWGTANNPIWLRRDPPEYFCCGDNSPQSKDSRLWWEICPMLRERLASDRYQLGTVPGDQLIGRAFFVYWPSGLRFSNDSRGVIPNVGRMRIIR